MEVHTHEKQRAMDRVWITVLAGCILLTLVLWFVVAELLSRESTDATFGFAPSSVPLAHFQMLYRVATVAVAFVLCILVCVTLLAVHDMLTVPTRAMRVTQWLLTSVALVFAALQVIAWTTSTHYARDLDGHKQAISTAFNIRFCETRALEICMESDTLETLETVIGGHGTNSAANTTTADAANAHVQASTLAIWLRCRDLLVASRAQLSTEQLHLLAATNTTAATDAWCGRAYVAQVAGGSSTDADATASADASDSPFDVNPDVFTSLARDWPARYQHDALFLGVASACAVALSWRLAVVRRRNGSDAFELFDMKAAGPSTRAHAAAPASVA